MVETSSALRADGAERYVERDSLGTGGMGEVRAYQDRRIGREIAIKRLHPERSEEAKSRKRFLREARIQGTLEHPSVVPVYDLGEDPDGTIFFTMKRIRGETLFSCSASTARCTCSTGAWRSSAASRTRSTRAPTCMRSG